MGLVALLPRCRGPVGGAGRQGGGSGRGSSSPLSVPRFFSPAVAGDGLEGLAVDPPRDCGLAPRPLPATCSAGPVSPGAGRGAAG